MRKKILSSSLGVFGSALLWLASFKIVALWLGPAGVGLFSQLRQILQVAASLGGINSIVQGVSERPREIQRAQFRTTVIKFSFLVGAITAFCLFYFASEFAVILFGYKSTEIVLGLQWIAIAALFSVLNIYILGVLNGYHLFGLLALVQIAGPLVMLTLLTILFFGKYEGTSDMLAILFFISFFITFVIGLFSLSRLPSITNSHLARELEKSEIISFLKFAFSTIIAALSGTFAMLLIRSWIIKYYGLEHAGLFDAAWTLSFNYITLFLTACSTLYLPALTQSEKGQAQRLYITKASHFVLASVALVSYIVVFFKTPLLRLLYSSKFESSASVLSILLLAILIRSVSWVYGLLLVSSKKSTIILISEVGFNGVSLISIWIAIHHYGTNESLAWAIFLANLLYFLFILVYVKRTEPAIRLDSICMMLSLALFPLVMFATNDQITLITFKFLSLPIEIYLFVLGIGVSFMTFRRSMNAM